MGTIRISDSLKTRVLQAITALHVFISQQLDVCYLALTFLLLIMNRWIILIYGLHAFLLDPCVNILNQS